MPARRGTKKVKTKKTPVKKDWVLDWGPGSTATMFETVKAAQGDVVKELRDRKTWAETFANDTVKDIERAIEKTGEISLTQGGSISVCVDRYTGVTVTATIKRRIPTTPDPGML